MSTETTNDGKSVDRSHVERNYDILLFPDPDGGVSLDGLREAEHPDGIDKGQSDAQQRAFATWLSSVAGRDEDAFDTKERTNEHRTISVGSETLNWDDYRAGIELYDDLMRAAANYGGQHPLSFGEVEDVSVKYRTSPDSVAHSALTDALDSIDGDITPSEEYDTFFHDGDWKWETGDGEQHAKLQVSSYSLINHREHPADGQNVPCIKIGVSIKAEAEAAVDILDNEMFERFSRALTAHPLGEALSVHTGEKETEVCKRTVDGDV